MTQPDWTRAATPRPPRWLELTAGERMISRTRSHPKTLIAPVVIAIVAVIVGIVAGRYARQTVDYAIDGHDIAAIAGWLLPVVFAAGGLLLVLRVISGWAAHTYTITNERIVERYGIASTGRREIATRRITETAMRRSLADRIFSAGTVDLQVAGGPGITLRSIPDAAGMQAVLGELTTNPVYSR